MRRCEWKGFRRAFSTIAKEDLSRKPWTGGPSASFSKCCERRAWSDSGGLMGVAGGVRCWVKTARAALALLSLIAILSAPRQLSAQTPRRPLIVDQSHYSVVAGERVSIQAPPETLEFMRSARTRIARASG